MERSEKKLANLSKKEFANPSGKNQQSNLTGKNELT